MKKEVVHVPTRGLAEEVLRVAKENRLYKDYDLESMLKQVKQGDLCIRPGVDYGFASFGYFEDKGYLVIAAQKFLNRYKDLLPKENIEYFKERISSLEIDVNNLNIVKSDLVKENAELKKQLKAIEDQPKVGDVCLFWDGDMNSYLLSVLKNVKLGTEYPYENENGLHYTNCIKATDENIQLKIKELQDEN